MRLAEVLSVCGYMNKGFERAHEVIIFYEREGNKDKIYFLIR